MSKVGLVTTFRFVPFLPHEGGREATDTFERCWSTLESFLLFHLSKGVEHIFLYADDDCGTNDIYVARVAEMFDKSQVSVDVRDVSQRARQQENCRLWAGLGSFSATEVPARQSLNAEEALRRAGKMGLDWLLHLDIDELFFTSEPSIQPHFDRLNKLGVEQMTYVNHEAVPSREEVGDYFREVQTFKVNHLMLPLSHDVAERTRFWRRRTGHGQYMLAYDNGKSAVRVLPDRIVPQSVHRWRTLKPGERETKLYPPFQAAGADVTGAASPLQGGHDGIEERSTGECPAAPAGVGGSADNGNVGDGQPRQNEKKEKDAQGCDQLVNRVAMADPRELRYDEVLECSDPCVLHYPSCGLSWLRDKYRLLGRFPSSWFNGKLPIAPCFHLDARNAVHEGRGTGAESDRNEHAAEGGDGGRALYRTEVMLCPEEHSEEMQAQLEHGVLRVISGPAQVIQRALDARGPPGSKVLPEIFFTTTEGVRLDSQAPGNDSREEGNTGETGSEGAEVMAREALLPPTVGAAAATAPMGGNTIGIENLAAGVDNAWILAACAREFL